MTEFTVVTCAFCGTIHGPFERWLDGESHTCERCLARSGLRVVKTSDGAVSLVPMPFGGHPVADVNHARKGDAQSNLTQAADC